MIKIVCFGDSNTYGYEPAAGGRYDEDTRWPKVMQKLLGDGYEVIEEGQNGRTIANDDPWEGGTKCGMDYVLPMLETKRPDLLIIMLGTNDLKIKFNLPVADIAGSMQTMLADIRSYCRYYLNMEDMKILLVSPPALSDQFEKSYFAAFFDAATVAQRSRELAHWYKLVAEQFGCSFLNATEKVTAGTVDHLHLDPEGHRKLAELVRDEVVRICG
ncbi:MAG: acylhydrolase [Lachnospiraceae bacterium]|nr:acylhydrolase [Lachnospiraceae bacterium]